MDAGRVAVIAPPSGYDMPFGPDRAAILSTFRPDAEAWEARGFDVTQTMPSDAHHAVVVLPRSRTLARGLMAEAAVVPGTVAVDGQKTDGADSLFKEVRARLGALPTITRDHGRLFWFEGGTDALDDWRLAGPSEGPEGFVTQPGVFSEGRADAGSALLAEGLPDKLPAHVVDLGAGWGYLSRAILAREGVERLDLVEAEARALDCARRNVTDPRAVFHWADATTFTPDAAASAVVMNPPFHEGRAGAPDLGRAFIAAAAGMLAPTGRLYCVANRHLPYETTLRERFRDVEERPGTPAFKLYVASRPARGNRLA